jgi:hypothetical protein
MLNAIALSIRFILLILAGQKQVAFEKAALRQQLAVFKRDAPLRPSSFECCMSSSSWRMIDVVFCISMSRKTRPLLGRLAR